jgi:hypothetical protein
MPGLPLRSVPTGPGVPAGGSAGRDVDIATEVLDADLGPALGAAAGTTTVVVSASLLDFLR